jgi:hypothetical protein
VAWPPALSQALWPLLPTLADEVIAAIGAEVPIYARPLEGNFGQGVRRGVQDALRGFLELLERGDREGASPEHRSVSFELGRGEVRQGRSLDALLAAYRVGARVTWRRCGAVASEIGLSGSDLVRLGELLFSVIDALSAAAAEGYAREQSERAGEFDRRRRRLAALLVSGSAAEATLHEAASAAGWRPPERLSAVVAADPEALRPLLADPETLPATDDQRSLALVPDAEGPGRRAQLEHLLAGADGPVVVGSAMPWCEVCRSVQRAQLALRLVEHGVLPAANPVWTGDVLVPLVVHADPELAEELAARELAPLAALPAETQARLAETLACWLARHGARAAVAEQLHVHPQTVRYRLGQLRELFGSALDDPERRFALALALRVRLSSSSLLGSAVRPPAAAPPAPLPTETHPAAALAPSPPGSATAGAQARSTTSAR